MYSVTKSFHFCAAHRLHDYEGKCSNIHGHNYKVEITLESPELVKDMVVDFGDMTRTIGKWIDDKLDHALLICRKDETLLSLLGEENMKSFRMNDKTTAENIARLIFQECNNVLRRDREALFVRKVVVWETETCCASYS